ncbi:hypothetical protein Tco_1260572 [Tanacetum coccineum]
MADGLSARMLMEHMDAQGFQLGGAKRGLSWRQFIGALGLHTVEEIESTASSSTVITYLILRQCHRLFACSIAGRSQAPKKVTVTDLFYLRGMDVGSVNVPYLLARYLRLFAVERKSRALISGGQFGSERQPDATAGAHEAAEDALAVDDDMPQAVPPLPRTQGERIIRLEEEVHGMCELLQGQSEVLDHMTRDFSRFATWTVTSLARMMDRAGVAYTSYSETPGEYQRRTRRRTDGASTSTAQQDQQQPDP